MSAISDFLSGLPTYNEENFSRYSGAGNSATSKRPSTYVPTTESPSEILIVNDETNVLIRYLARKWAKESRGKKRCSLISTSSCSKKRRRVEGDDDSA
ncbi:hypothetical protein GE061_007918 [Apolygus lucorum]|uniref:DET1- and DDB1-associated protein 1 n=1 Tax=Apolygus lucorum TaxID=248454 RepID=A0A8S9WPW0_APOLU|nr:hypothetical protein GE061_007918 [Apolygus lucorum]